MIRGAHLHERKLATDHAPNVGLHALRLVGQ
jgi:hypothetical protein